MRSREGLAAGVGWRDPELDRPRGSLECRLAVKAQGTWGRVAFQRGQLAEPGALYRKRRSWSGGSGRGRLLLGSEPRAPLPAEVTSVRPCVEDSCLPRAVPAKVLRPFHCKGKRFPHSETQGCFPPGRGDEDPWPSEGST